MEIRIEIENNLSKKEEMELRAQRQEILNRIAINDYVINHFKRENAELDDKVYAIEKILANHKSKLVSNK